MIIGLPRPPEVLRSPAAGDSAADDGGVRRGPHPRGSDRALLAAELGRSSRPSGPCRRQLVQVVRGGDEAPLTGDLRGTAQEELPEAPDVFHDPEHRLHRSLTQSVAAPPPAAAQPLPHRRDQSARPSAARVGRAGLPRRWRPVAMYARMCRCCATRRLCSEQYPASAETSAAWRPVLALIWTTSGSNCAASVACGVTCCATTT